MFIRFITVFFERFAGRSALLDFAAEKNIHVAQTKAKPWSTDENLFHISYEAGILEDPNVTPPKEMWKLTVDPEDAPNTPERITISFEKGIPVKVVNHNDGHEETEPVKLFTYLNTVVSILLNLVSSVSSLVVVTKLPVVPSCVLLTRILRV